jgi:hypothetical protein
MAELEILEALVGVFCPTSEAASTCREFISNHSQVLPPIGPLFYFLLFPIVFTILFIYILSSTILHGGNLTKGMRLLVGISVFIFIIISGWYPVMLVLSEFWFIMIIVLFGAWYFIGKHRGGGVGSPGKGGGSLPGLGGISGEITSRIYRDATGQTKRSERWVDLQLTQMRTIAEVVEKDTSAWRAYSTAITQCQEAVLEYRNKLTIGGVVVGGDIKNKIEQLEAILAKIQKHRPKN